MIVKYPLKETTHVGFQAEKQDKWRDKLRVPANSAPTAITT
jgi:hypothetical protein